tara:strand:- start:391 stop:534 length:144 start_codon:yes stop_codon:yes gene_type:complete
MAIDTENMYTARVGRGKELAIGGPREMLDPPFAQFDGSASLAISGIP